MAKRSGASDVIAPSAKRISLAIPPLDIGPACGEEDLNVKVLQVQNAKLSERLRERNFAREQLEVRLEEAEGRLEEQRRALASLPRHMLALRAHLAPLLPDHVGLEGLARVGEEVRPETCLEEGFRCALAALRHLGSGESKKEDVRTTELSPQTLDEKLHVGQLQDENKALQSRCEDTENALADARFDLGRRVSHVLRLERQLAEAMEHIHSTPHNVEATPTQQATPTTVPVTPASGDREKTTNEEVVQLSTELEETRALAEDRLKEIEQLSQQIVQLRVDMELAREQKGESSVASSDGTTSAAYLSLQAQFSIVQQENSQLRSCIDELKTLLYEARAQHFTQLDELRVEEVKYEGEVREEMAQLESLLATAKREYELLRIEFEKRMAANEQAAPLAKELQVTVESLQKTISQLKSEVNRYKTRAHKAEARLQEEMVKQKTTPSTPDNPAEPSTAADHVTDEHHLIQDKVKTLLEEKKVLEAQLEAQCQSSQDGRERTAILASERKARSQVEELKKKCEELRKDCEKRKEHVKEEAMRRSKALAEDNKHLQRELVAKRQETQALVSEMECTAQAFEEVQEQNLRLLQQIKEKDDANFKVISERIKASSMQKLLMEEKELLHSQISNIVQEKNRMSDVMTRLEEREKNHEATLVAMEKDLALKQQAMDSLRKKALESSQIVQTLQLQAAEEEREREVSREKVRERLEEREKATQQSRRAQEEVASLKRKLERYKSREWASASDEVLLEEIRTYKVKLNCPCCSTRKKDTVLTKCFHVFCSECIRSRYDSRLRKCPKCGAAFGANDFHKLYLS